MELVCEKALPGSFDFFLLICDTAELFCKNAEHFVALDCVFAAAVVFLYKVLACKRTSVIFIVHFAVPYGKLFLLLCRDCKEIVNVADVCLRQTGEVLQTLASFKHPVCGAAAAVTVAVHLHSGVKLFLVVALTVGGHKLGNAENAVVAGLHHMSHNLRAVVTLPAEHIERELVCIIIRKL